MCSSDLPSNSNTEIDLSAFEGNAVRIELFDATGKKLRTADSIRNSSYVLHRDGLPEGMYFIRISADGKSYTKKLILN